MRRAFARINGGTLDRHPVAVVAGLDEARIDELLADTDLVGLVAAQLVELDELLDAKPVPRVAYFSPEFGISDLIPQFSGGLGILAGDHLKASSDLAVPVVGVGLFYREGFFRQVITDGAQEEEARAHAAESLGAHYTGVDVQVPLPGRDVSARVWRMDVGTVSLLLLDTDVPENDAADRNITDRLYSGDRRHRLEQELILGVGGARALSAIGWDLPVHHLNEGHAGFLILELIDRAIDGGDLLQAVDAIRHGVVFTTHTPVPAGIDRFERELITPYLEVWAQRWGVSPQAIWNLGADPKKPADRFNMAALGLRVATAANGVSELHGVTSRALFAGVGIGDEITSITNGVHARTWVGEDAQNVYDTVLGPTWAQGDPDSWERIESLSDTALAAMRQIGSLTLAETVGRSTGRQLDPDALVIGFARRFAMYKRATLLFQHPERLGELLAADDRPVHFVFAGKAHPADEDGKALLSEVVAFAESAEARGRFTFIPNYGIEVARAMYAGCDIWLNTPVHPREASGTSGEKAALNGGLNCSILDGWWAEMYDGTNGWEIPLSGIDDPDERDVAESLATFEVLDRIVAEYYGDAPAFLGRIRRSLMTLGPRVTAARMVAEYRDRIYGPVLDR